MEYKKTTYEIIEMYPNILRHKIPLIQILMATLYYGTFPFILIYLFYKKGLSFFSKIEFTKGSESNPLTYHFDLESLEPLDLTEVDMNEEILNTESIYYSIKESIFIGEELESEGFNIIENAGEKYKIKKRVETYYTTEYKEDEKKVIISIPRIAISIHEIFKTLKLVN